MGLFTRKHDAEIARYREALTIVVAGFSSRLEAIEKTLADLPHALDAKFATEAIEAIRESGQQVGIALQQAALLTDREDLLEVAAETAATRFEVADLLREHPYA